MRRLLFLPLVICYTCLQAQYGAYTPPDKLYGPLFTDVQMNHVFTDGKTFVDCIPKKDPAEIAAAYKGLKNNPRVRYSLKLFVEANFTAPAEVASGYVSDTSESVSAHINKLWKVLLHQPDEQVTGSTLLPLPNAYIVPGGRFREIYYWDSYFTMLGLQESGMYDVMESMVNNFSYMIQQYGHIPNGNRTYFLSRSQPPFFSMMLDLLAEKTGNRVYAQYQVALQREYNYWMDKTAAKGHAVKMPDGTILNRYYDQDIVPRQESYYEDSTLGAAVGKKAPQLYRNLRSGAESGWDFSSRWLADGKTLATIQTVNFIPVDLNCLLYHLELTLSKAYKETGDLVQSSYYQKLAIRRKNAILKYCWNTAGSWFTDYNHVTGARSKELTLAGLMPLFVGIATTEQGNAAARTLESRFLKAGGLVTSLKTTGQQWDAPNGWAPLQWMGVQAMNNYNKKELAKSIAARWVQLNTRVYKATGKLMEKYNVTDANAEGGGGEYPAQDGFGWTNGVLLKLIKLYNLQ
ncbi:alpha,alpha-trehalase [Filimonas lacunae]|uniref:Alpha,alpha-trehalase n=1 Tax=Filimonas lacunae TaxID=477680 RepID=A0A1N7MBI3_9BACT|nr:alpha,alpha-trehalase TreF [Filimonas lacunae]SIS83464.1 alpha,alpha-trehalase [Filimonas lacunae]